MHGVKNQANLAAWVLETRGLGGSDELSRLCLWEAGISLRHGRGDHQSYRRRILIRPWIVASGTTANSLPPKGNPETSIETGAKLFLVMKLGRLEKGSNNPKKAEKDHHLKFNGPN